MVWLLLCGAALLLLSAILLGNFIFHDIDGAPLKLLAYLLLLALPCVFYPLTAVTLVFTNNLVLFFPVKLGHKLQVKQGVVQDFKVLQLLRLGLLHLNFQLLIGSDLFLFNETCRRFNQTDFVIQ